MKGAVGTQAVVLLLLVLHLHSFRVLSQSDGSAAPMEEKEKKALYSMIQNFVGRSWNGSGLYPDLCGWTPIQGISCDYFDNGLWYITTVSIGPVLENSLQCSPKATFSHFLFELSHLKSLSIFSCFSSPSAHQAITIPPKNWEKLSSSLETLELRSNKGLIGQIPPVFGKLVNLKSLVLTENSLSGEIPIELGNLVRLNRLTLSENQLSGEVPASLGSNLAELLIMDISRNSLTGFLNAFGGLTSLLKLDLSNNLLSGNLPEELGSLKNLTLLDLRNNNLSGGLPLSLQGMSSLQYMLLSSNPMGGRIEEFGWKTLQKLIYLDLSNMGFVGRIPESITELKSLRFIALDKNKLTGPVSTKLASLPCLSALYLNGNNLTGELGFSEAFYERMGRRFASWDNPNLCYRSAAGRKIGKGPEGVAECSVSLLKSENKMIRDERNN
ncbi:Piriformospora indica-insensitive protein 2 [Apostasia shenzhenica]|uniref:Piriformospora indica-insensitive protein 2 n=1 Tax=Apostasia shenzhenica TaxID=1088818 RepID=A0A2I0B2M3_9ASPA|nr:Piriformospora indica-insensitive protein 2 [Apostasia shenzhenica]